MMAVPSAGSLESGRCVLAQRGSGPFRAAIRRERPGGHRLVITLEKLNTTTLQYELLCSFAPEEWCEAVAAIVALKDAIPEASRALGVEQTFLRGAA
jgi:hypothetical protein